MYMEWIAAHNLTGLVIGISTFLIIGLFHPLVIKAEYYLGARSWWLFLVLGLMGIVASVSCSQVIWSTLFGVVAFSSFWSIMEVFEQEKRVKKGWFPRNPKRRYPWDVD